MFLTFENYCVNQVGFFIRFTIFRSMSLLPYFEYSGSKGSGETVGMCRLI